MVKNPDCEKTPSFKYLRLLQRVIIILLLFIMSLILLLATFNIVFFIIKDLFLQPLDQLSASSLMDLFSIFLVILIGVELLETVKAFLLKEVIQVEIVVLVAIIAIARKIIIWEFSDSSPHETYGLAAILFTLAITYFLLKRTRFKFNFHTKKTPIIKPSKYKNKDIEVQKEDTIL